MKYSSATQIAKCVNEFLLAEVHTADINKCLQQLGYLDNYNRPTPKSAGTFAVGTNFYGRNYYKWDENIVEEVKEKFYEDSWRL